MKGTTEMVAYCMQSNGPLLSPSLQIQTEYPVPPGGGGGRPLGSGCQLPPQVTVGWRPLGGGGGDWRGVQGGAMGGGGLGGARGGGRSGRVGCGGAGVPGGAIWGVGGEGGHRLPLPLLALPLIIPSPET